MRLSPVLVAVLSTSATLAFSNSAKAQMLYYGALGTEPADPSAAMQANAATATVAQQTSAAVVSLVNPPEALPLPTPESVAPATIAQPEMVTQAPPTAPDSTTPASQTPPVPGGPPPGSATPSQETPNQLQFDVTPGQPVTPITPPSSQPASPDLSSPQPTQPTQPTQPAPTGEAEPRVLVSEVSVSGVEGDLQERVYQAIRIRPGRTATRSELQESINAVFATGLFSNVRAVPEDTPLGVRVTFVVQANPILRSVQVTGNQVLPQQVIDDIFSKQYGSTLNLVQFQEGIKLVNKWYQDNGYVLAQVIDAPQVSEDGAVTLQVAEGVVESIQVRFLNKEGEDTDEKGQPFTGRTRDFIITREFNLKPGDVFNRTQVERDLQRVFGLGIFEDVRLSLNPGEDPRKVIVVANVIERNSGSLAAGLGVSSASGLFGTVSFQEQNLGGNNQKLGAEVQLGEREFLFDLSFTDPWIGGDPFRTAYTVNFFNRRSLSLVFDDGPRAVRLANGDRPRIDRLGGGINFTRPLNNGWTASLGLQYQSISVRDFNRNIVPRDQFNNPLSISPTGIDDLLTVQAGAVQDLRNDPLRPTTGSLLRLGVEQSIPIGNASIFLNRLRGSYSYYLPVSYLNLAEGPQALAFNIQAGTALGDLPPYEAFALGGSSSVRGYEEGAVGSGRSFIQATAEYRFPIFSIVGGALFVDAATDLGSGSSVIGDPAGIRRKPGSGFGYGLGVRIQSPLGPIRVDFGLNDQGSSRIHFGIGERF